MAAFKRHRHKIWAVFGAYLASVLIYWVCNMKEVPITRRVRFMSFDSDEISDLTEEAAKAMVQENVILELSHPAVQRVLKTAKRIIAANNDIERMKEMEWTVSMVDVPGMINAMVTGKGQIIIFKDIVDACATDDELGIILAHEMSHAILDHVPEKISNTYLVGFFTAPILFLIWALLPSDLWAAVFHFLYHNATSFAISLPYSRMLEEEADAVGLQLAARACIDVRQAVSFWKRMDYKQKVDTGFLGDEGIPKSLEYFSTHPTHESRWRKMETILEEALVLRDQCHCPALGPLPKDFGLRFVKEEGEKAAHIRILL
ncbi:Metalloendopeptidase OMA1, mitochondrial [Halotydeus destructor]|nr:Metalloendopeptidase OMA1, mitochondrial [Halotydeus destructor]